MDLLDLSRICWLSSKTNSLYLNKYGCICLWDTYGFPIDLTQLMAEEKGLTVDVEGFDVAMKETRKKARNVWNKVGSATLDTCLPEQVAFIESMLIIFFSNGK